MKTTNTFSRTENKARFESDIAPQSLAAASQTAIPELKAELVKRLSSEFPEVQLRLVRQAVVEADALASLTIVPYLLLPALAEEKVRSLSYWTVHQRAIAGNAGWAFAA